jgi:hypothetical protein
MEQSHSSLYLLLCRVQNRVCISLGRVKEVMADSRFPRFYGMSPTMIAYHLDTTDYTG